MTAPSTIRQRFLTRPGELGVVAVGFSGGQGKPGADTAPQALIDAGLLTQLSDQLGYTLVHDPAPTADTPAGPIVHDYAAVLPDPAANAVPYRGMNNARAVSAVTRALAGQVRAHAAAGRFALTLGGDHSIAMGSISGTVAGVRDRTGGKREPAVIWVDAHADINTPETSESGNIHGMPLSFVTGLAKGDGDDLFGWIRDEHKLPLSKLIYIGLRDVDRGEKQILREHGICAFSMHDIDRYGIGPVVERALAHVGADTPLHLSFDVDALDPQWAPSTGTPVRGGLTLREGDYIAERVHETGNLIAMDLVEVNPALGGERGREQNEIAAAAAETVRTGCSLVRCALGDTLL